MQWNLGNRFWVRKQEDIQAIVDQQNPDIMIITEANMFKEDPEHCLIIERYNIVRPLTWNNPSLNYARVVFLIKPEINFVLLEDFMEQDISAIWIKISRRGTKKLIVGGIYREHQFLKQIDNTSLDIRCQEDRWRRTVTKWTDVTANSDSIVIGDLNLDHSTWNTPRQSHINMIETVKTEVETRGFFQVI